MSCECVLKCGKPCKPTDIINQGKWESLQLKTQNYSGLDKFGFVYTTPWEDRPANHCMHLSCYSHLEFEGQKKVKSLC